MQTRHRSRDNSQQSKTNCTKSLMKGSVETKQQTTCRNSPKPLRNKLKSCKKVQKKKNAIKQISKLSYLMQKLTSKLNSFEVESVNISVKSSMETKESSRGKMSEQQFCNKQIKVSEATGIICEQMNSLRNALSIQSEKIKNKKQLIQQKQAQTIKYESIFNKALAKPNCLKKIRMRNKMQCNEIISQNMISLQEQINHYKKQQNENWSYLNKQLLKYLNDIQSDKSSKQKKIIIKELEKQGRANLRWIQMIQKMSLSDFAKFNQKRQIKAKQNNEHQIQQICQNDHPLGAELFLQTYKWDKYIWNDENVSSGSDMQQKDEAISEQGFNLSSSQLLQQCDQIQENVQIITEFLLNQFVIQLANKLDLNSRLKIGINFKNNYQSNQHDNLNEEYANFLRRIDQIAEDCLQIDSIGQNYNKQISPIIAQALIETIRANPTLSSVQSKQKLKDAICKREFEISEFIKLEEQEEYDWLKLTAMAELEQAVFEGIVMEEVCKLWMG